MASRAVVEAKFKEVVETAGTPREGIGSLHLRVYNPSGSYIYCLVRVTNNLSGVTTVTRYMSGKEMIAFLDGMALAHSEGGAK